MTDAQPRSAEGYAAPFDQGFVVEMSPGRRFECQYLPFTEQLVEGKVPNELFRFVTFEKFTPDDYRITEKGEIVAKTDAELSVEQRKTWENYARIVARACLFPRIILKGKADRTAGQLELRNMTHHEVREIAWRATQEVLPDPATFPMGRPDADGTSADVPGGSVEPGAGDANPAAPAATEAGPGADTAPAR